MKRHPKQNKRTSMKYKVLFSLTLAYRGWKLYTQIVVTCGAFAASAIAFAKWLPWHDSWIVDAIQSVSLVVMLAIVAILSLAFWQEMHGIKSAAQAKKAMPTWFQALFVKPFKK